MVQVSAQTLIIRGTLPSLNEVIDANRASHHAGAKLKRGTDETIGWSIKASRLRPVSRPVRVDVLWVEPSRRRDPDNIASGVKFILDALQKQGVIAGDGHRHVTALSHTFAFDRDNPRVVVTLTETEEGSRQ